MATKALEEKALREAPFDPSRLPISDPARLLVADVRGQLLRYEAHRHPRKRARKKVDQDTFDRIVSAIVCDLMHCALVDPNGWRHISLSKRHSAFAATGATFMTEERIRVIQWMASPEMDWLEVRKGNQLAVFGTQTVIRASARLKDRMDEHGIQFDDLGHDPLVLRDPIVLRGHKVRGRAPTLVVPDGEPAHTYRAEMTRINAWLTALSMEVEPDEEGNLRDVSNRQLRRIFNDGRLDHGGRLYGGFWMDMSATDRLNDITIQGERIVSLDFGQCGVRIAYAHVGVTPPPGDLYCVPGLEGFREGVKKVLNSQLANPKAMTRKPAGTAKLFTKHHTIREIDSAIVSHHHPIRDLFYQGMGTRLLFVESQVLVRCLLTLINISRPVLPVHDCLLAPRSSAAEVSKIMLDCFKAITGAEGIVTIRGDISPSSP
jgi:hypothetical protein